MYEYKFYLIQHNYTFICCSHPLPNKNMPGDGFVAAHKGVDRTLSAHQNPARLEPEAALGVRTTALVHRLQ